MIDCSCKARARASSAALSPKSKSPNVSLALGCSRRLPSSTLLAPVLAVQVGEEGLCIDRGSDGTPERLLRGELATVGVYVLAEPFAQCREVAALDPVGEVSELIRGFFP